MRVFVTGSTGFVGSAVVQELLAAGHQVLGLVRSDASATVLGNLGVEAHRGDLSDLDSLVAGARNSDGVIHTAFIHDFSAYAAAAETDRRAIETLVGALEGTGKPFVSTSGTALLAHGSKPVEGAPALERLSIESDVPSPGGPGSHRAAAEAMVLAAGDRGVRSSVIRLPPSVHGAGDHGFVPSLIGIARRTGISAYVNEGANRWPAVHRYDAARLYRHALEGAAAGAPLHGVAEEGVPFRKIAEAIGAGLGLPVRSMTAEEAAEHFGWMGGFVSINNPTSSERTRESLGWNPEGIDLLTDIRESGYFG